MEYSDCTGYEIANPNNKRIMTVFETGREVLPDKRVDKKRVALDLARSAIYLIDSDDKRDPLVAHVIIDTVDGERMVKKSSDSSFEEAIFKEIEVSTSDSVVSLPVVVGENVRNGLDEIGISNNDINSISFDLFEKVDINPTEQDRVEAVYPEASKSVGDSQEVSPGDHAAKNAIDEFYIVEVKINLTKEECKSSVVNPDDFVFKEKKKPEIDKALLQERELSDFEEIVRFISKISKSIKKILHFA